MSAWFITSSGTHVGKTLVTCALVHALREAGKSVIVQKPVLTGWEATSECIRQSDTGLLLSAAGQPITAEAIDATSPWRFTAPLSPHVAAQYEGKIIKPDALVAWSSEPAKGLGKDQYLLVEGVGGAMVPLTHSYHSLQWMQALGFGVLLVVGDYLGALSHTLTTLTALLHYHIKVQAIIVSGCALPPMPIAETVMTLQGFTDVPVIPLPFIAHEDAQQKWEEGAKRLKGLCI